MPTVSQSGVKKCFVIVLLCVYSPGSFLFNILYLVSNKEKVWGQNRILLKFVTA